MRRFAYVLLGFLLLGSSVGALVTGYFDFGVAENAGQHVGATANLLFGASGVAGFRGALNADPVTASQPERAPE